MKKLIYIIMISMMLATTASAAKIEYYNATRSINKDLGVDATVASAMYYVPALLVAGTIETIFVPVAAILNLFQDEE